MTAVRQLDKHENYFTLYHLIVCFIMHGAHTTSPAMHISSKLYYAPSKLLLPAFPTLHPTCPFLSLSKQALFYLLVLPHDLTSIREKSEVGARLSSKRCRNLIVKAPFRSVLRNPKLQVIGSVRSASLINSSRIIT